MTATVLPFGSVPSRRSSFFDDAPPASGAIVIVSPAGDNFDVTVGDPSAPDDFEMVAICNDFDDAVYLGRRFATAHGLRCEVAA